ncbi:MAG: hypothetical protein ACRD1X_10235 [Vicinamibacteria bacterium]
MVDGLAELDHDALWDAVGTKNWERVGEILKESGYDFEDLGMLALQARDDDADSDGD